MIDLFWEYTLTHKFHWINDEKVYRVRGKIGMKYESERWAIVDRSHREWIPIADRQKLKMIKKYDLYHKGKIIMSSNEVKELKWFVQEYERKRGNRVFATYTYMMNVLLKEREK